MIIDEMKVGRSYPILVSPIAQTGISVQLGDLIPLAAHFDGQADTAAQTAQYGYALLTKLGVRPAKDGKPMDGSEAVAQLEREFEVVLSEKFPLWRRLGVI